MAIITNMALSFMQEPCQVFSSMSCWKFPEGGQPIEVRQRKQANRFMAFDARELIRAYAAHKCFGPTSVRKSIASGTLTPESNDT